MSEFSPRSTPEPKPESTFNRWLKEYTKPGSDPHADIPEITQAPNGNIIEKSHQNDSLAEGNAARYWDKDHTDSTDLYAVDANGNPKNSHWERLTPFGLKRALKIGAAVTSAVFLLLNARAFSNHKKANQAAAPIMPTTPTITETAHDFSPDSDNYQIKLSNGNVFDIDSASLSYSSDVIGNNPKDQVGETMGTQEVFDDIKSLNDQALSELVASIEAQGDKITSANWKISEVKFVGHASDEYTADGTESIGTAQPHNAELAADRLEKPMQNFLDLATQENIPIDEVVTNSIEHILNSSQIEMLNSLVAKDGRFSNLLEAVNAASAGVQIDGELGDLIKDLFIDQRGTIIEAKFAFSIAVEESTAPEPVE